jgi:hypothetical protein
LTDGRQKNIMAAKVSITLGREDSTPEKSPSLGLRATHDEKTLLALNRGHKLIGVQRL